MEKKLIAIGLLEYLNIIAATIGLTEVGLAIVTGWKLAWKIAGVCGCVYLLCKLWENVIVKSI